MSETEFRKKNVQKLIFVFLKNPKFSEYEPEENLTFPADLIAILHHIFGLGCPNQPKGKEKENVSKINSFILKNTILRLINECLLISNY